MREARVLTVVVGNSCSLCATALDNLRSPARILRVLIAIERLDVGDNRKLYADRVPVVKSRSGRVLAEGRIGPGKAWVAVWRGRFGRRV